MELPEVPSLNPKEHAKNIEDILSSLRHLCENEIDVFEDPKGKALLQTTAEVLGGLEKAFHHYVTRDDVAWREEPEAPSAQNSSDPWD